MATNQPVLTAKPQAKAAPISARVTMTREDGTTFQVAHGIPSGKRRVMITEIVARSVAQTAGASAKLVEAVVRARKELGENATNEVVMSHLMETNELTAQDLLESARGVKVEDVEKQMTDTYELFRACADLTKLDEADAELIASDDFMSEQNIVEIENFIQSFRKIIGA